MRPADGSGDARPRVVIIQNWVEELKQRAPN
jgi:hypothetical protein